MFKFFKKIKNKIYNKYDENSKNIYEELKEINLMQEQNCEKEIDETIHNGYEDIYIRICEEEFKDRCNFIDEEIRGL